MIIVLLINICVLFSYSTSQQASVQSLSLPTLNFNSDWLLGLAFVFEILAIILCLGLLIFNGLDLPRVFNILIYDPWSMRSK